MTKQSEAAELIFLRIVDAGGELAILSADENNYLFRSDGPIAELVDSGKIVKLLTDKDRRITYRVAYDLRPLDMVELREEVSHSYDDDKGNPHTRKIRRGIVLKATSTDGEVLVEFRLPDCYVHRDCLVRDLKLVGSSGF